MKPATPEAGADAASLVAAEAGQGSGMRGVAWSSIALGANRVVVFLLTLVLARLLVPADFGVVTAGLTVIALLEVGLDLGIGSAIVYEQDRGITDRVRSAFALNLVVCGVVSLLCIAAAPAIAGFFGVSDVALFQVLFIYPLLRGAGQVHDAVLKRDLQFKRRMLVDVLRAVARVVVSIPLALAGFGAWSIVLGLLAAEVAGTATNWSLVRVRPRFTIGREEVSSLLRFGLTLTVARAVGTLQTNADNLVVGNQLGIEVLGFYGVAYRLPELLLSNLYWVFTGVAFPVYARARKESLEALRHTALRGLMLLSLFGFSVGTGLAIVSRDAVVVLFSAQWAPAAAPMVLISLGIAAMAVAPACGDVMPAVGRPGALLPLQIPAVILAIVGFVVASDRGIVAVATVHLLYGLAFALVHMVMAKRVLAASVGEFVTALRPACCAALGITALALPVRLTLDPGVPALVLTVAAGSAGAAAGLAIGSRRTFGEVRKAIGQALGR